MFRVEIHSGSWPFILHGANTKPVWGTAVFTKFHSKRNFPVKRRGARWPGG